MPTEISGATGVNKIQDGTIVNADINDLAASKLTGALPAIDGASLTNVALPDTGWVNLTGFEGTWVAYNSDASWQPAYRVIGKVVYLKGLVKNGSLASLLTLPSAIDPARNFLMHRPATDVNSNTLTSHPSLYINGANLSTNAFASGWTAITCSYPLD